MNTLRARAREAGVQQSEYLSISLATFHTYIHTIHTCGLGTLVLCLMPMFLVLINHPYRSSHIHMIIIINAFPITSFTAPTAAAPIGLCKEGYL